MHIHNCKHTLAGTCIVTPGHWRRKWSRKEKKNQSALVVGSHLQGAATETETRETNWAISGSIKHEDVDVLLSAVKSLFEVTAEIRKHLQDTKQTLDSDDGVAASSCSCASSFTSVFDKKLRCICKILASSVWHSRCLWVARWLKQEVRTPPRNVTAEGRVQLLDRRE